MHFLCVKWRNSWISHKQVRENYIHLVDKKMYTINSKIKKMLPFWPEHVFSISKQDLLFHNWIAIWIQEKIFSIFHILYENSIPNNKHKIIFKRKK